MIRMKTVTGLMLLFFLLSACQTMTDPVTSSADRSRPPEAQVEVASTPSPEIQAIAERMLMTPLARTIFFKTEPELQARAPFTSSCPAKEKRQILGCYVNRRVFILQVEQPDLAPIMDVTAAHEMLHAAYQDLNSSETDKVNNWTTQFYKVTGSKNEALRQMLERYPASERTNELHSLLGTQVKSLTPELERYYGRYFVRRDAVVGAHGRSDGVFTELEKQHAQLVSEIQKLAAEIDRLVGQQTTQTSEAQRLSAEIQTLRESDRVEESNSLVPLQNAAADRVTGLQRTINSIIEQHNNKVEKINQLVFRQDQLIRSLGAS